jgi:hypothetical protein
VDCSFIVPGFILQIGTRRIVSAISGTAPVSGNSTITLSAAWDQPTTTDKLIGWNSYESLPNIVNRIQNALANQTAIGELTTNGLLERTGPNAFQTVTATAKGKELIGAADAAAGRAALGLGSAATLTAMASLTDGTAGRLMPVGAFGLGEGVDGAAATIDLNSLTHTQFMQVRSTSTNGPAGVGLSGAMLLHLQWATSEAAYQVLWTLSGRRFERQRVSDAWDAQWRDVSAGIGISTTQDVNCDTLTLGGLYRATSGGRPNNIIQHTLHINRAANAQAAQIMIEDSSGGGLSWRNRLSDGSWTAFKIAYHRANILGPVSFSGGVNTGAIIERGSNANGEFVRFADGTMICTHSLALTSVSVSANDQATVLSSATFPAAFIATPAVDVSHIGGFSARYHVGTEGTTATSWCSGTGVSFRNLDNTTRSVAPVLTLSAIGRWR